MFPLITQNRPVFIEESVYTRMPLVYSFSLVVILFFIIACLFHIGMHVITLLMSFKTSTTVSDIGYMFYLLSLMLSHSSEEI
jgi:hypothetical protein